MAILIHNPGLVAVRNYPTHQSGGKALLYHGQLIGVNQLPKVLPSQCDTIEA